MFPEMGEITVISIVLQLGTVQLLSGEGAEKLEGGIT